MKYALYFAGASSYFNDNNSDYADIYQKSGFMVGMEKFDDFSEAVKRYTLACSYYPDVVLADLEKNEIIRQLSTNGEDIAIK